MNRERESPVKIRNSEENDLDALVRVINRAFEVERPVFDGDRIDIQGILGYRQKGTFLIAEDTTAIIGCVYAEIRGESGYIGLLSVEPEQQGRGLGRRLMEVAENLFRQMGCTKAELRIVSARTALLGFYRHLGYTESRIEPLAASVRAKVPCHFQYMGKMLVST